MVASRSAQLARPYLEQPADAVWRQKRLELLQPEQEQRLSKRRWEAAPFVLLAMLVLTAAFAYMCLDAQIGLAGREINNLQVQIKEEEALGMRTEVEIGSLSSLARIESYAQLHLGMVYPDIKAVYYLDQQVSNMLTAELIALAEAVPEPELAAEQRPMLAVWTEALKNYISGTALAVED
jgi:cell division protein FtsL